MGEPARPDPDKLLERIRTEEKKSNRGELKIFFGYAAGVGKTFAMLEAAHEINKTGIDVLVGYIEPHTRPETLALLEGFEVLEPKTVFYKGISLREFDLDGALKRKPRLILVDELAHTNAEGLRHRKRWQDIEELLAAGIDVYSTVNVQHLESLNDVVASITHVIVKETVPDRVFDQADHVELIDIEPEDLLRRFSEGKIYGKEQARRATYHFFTKNNLDALREIALRRTADRVNRDVENARLSKEKVTVLPTSEQLLASVSPSPSSARVIRTAARMAEAFHAKWVALYVETSRSESLSEAVREQLRSNLNLAEQLGAEIVTVYGEDVAEQVVQYANLRNITKIVMGKNHKTRTRFFSFYAKDIVDKIMDSTSFIDVHVIPGNPQDYNKKVNKRHLPLRFPQFRFSWTEVIKTLSIMTIATLFAMLFRNIGFAEANSIMVYIIGVLLVSINSSGYWMGITASVIGVLAFNYFFTEPRFTFAVHDTSYLTTFPVMLIVALITSTLTTRMQDQAEVSSRREQRTQILFQISRSLLRTTGKKEITALGLEQLSRLFNRGVIGYLMQDDNNLSTPFLHEENAEEEIEALLAADEQAVAHWVLSNGKAAGAGTDTLPGSHAFYMPIKGQKDILGVIGISSAIGVLEPEQRSLFETVTAQIALALDRERLAEEQEYSKMEIERERLRSNLLRAISHDLRSPLTGIGGAASTILENDLSLNEDTKQKLLQGIYDDAEWLTRLVENLLSITRIDEGKMEVIKTLEAVEEVVAEAVQRVNKRGSDHLIKVKIPDTLLMVPMDGKLIVQVLINLVDNALKYTPKGTEIEVNVYPKETRIVFAVADRGPGIPEKAIGQLFDRFYTTENKVTDSRRGVGLGLAICKSIVTAHGGTIEALNRKGGGAIFRFGLPTSNA